MEDKELYIVNPSKDDFDYFDEDLKYVCDAHNCLLKKLFGFVPSIPSNYTVILRAYKKAMRVPQLFAGII